MKVKDLIEQLSKFNPEHDIVVSNWRTGKMYVADRLIEGALIQDLGWCGEDGDEANSVLIE